MNQHILILYYSRNGATKAMANRIAQGVESTGMQAKLRTVPEVSDGIDHHQPGVPDSGDLFVQKNDLKSCAGLALGSPTRFGNMASALKYFIDSTSNEWLSGALVDKPASVFTSTGSMHGGQESTLLSMMLPLLHHGMVIAGLPYTHPELHNTTTGGSPYGATHYAHGSSIEKLSEDERTLCFSQGQRLATLAQKLASQ
ncbi:NAD(P)H:quinone oxidoreductase [Paraglaciecola sp. 20A4]|uniref:NAD(P)H:quinone oxidoreductase n=1 Tax=Paraglaciecola sp. 20A4 TaxID=2687288 RepID=UPI00140E75E7|nr:NAD(P)H:quinone oxidoreductase [Paraglaciecola sp. 20A4]